MVRTFSLVMASVSLALVTVLPSQEVRANSTDKLATRITDAASKSLGQEMWKGYGLPNGVLGCAAAVSNVLNKAGVKAAHSAGVVVMRNQLRHGSIRCQEFVIKNGSADLIDDQLLLKVSKPGDILVAFRDPPSSPNTGGNAHCGIMSDSPNVYTNDWNDGIWKKVNIHTMFDSYRHVRLLRLMPADCEKTLGAGRKARTRKSIL